MKVITRRFEVEEKIGSGGMSTVYRALDRDTGGRVALKVLRRGGMADAERFDREARVLADLTHPAIVRYVAHGQTDEGDPYLAMEWLEGEDLEARLKRSMLAPSEAVRLGVRVAEALGEAHAHGIIHRDIKPSNIFLEGGEIGRVKLLDFGMARWSQVARMATITGTVLGTPAYMAPEQARGDKKVGPQADVFALGCVLFECLTGKAAFAGDHMLATLSKLLLEEPPRILPENGLVPPLLAAAVERMMERDPARRPANGVEAAMSLMSLSASLEAPRSEALTKRSATPSPRRAMTPTGVRVQTADEGAQAPSRKIRRPSSKEVVAIRPLEEPPPPPPPVIAPPRAAPTSPPAAISSAQAATLPSPPAAIASAQAATLPSPPAAIASAQVTSSPPPTPPSSALKRKRKLSPPPRRAVGASLYNLLRAPSSMGPVSEAVLSVMGRHIPMPWAMLKAQCDRIGLDASDIPPGDLPVLADILLTAASRFVGRAARTEMLNALLEIYARG